MNLIVIILIYTSIVLNSFTFSITYLKTINNHELLPKFACKIIKNAIDLQSHTQDLLIADLRIDTQSTITNQLLRCSANVIPVILTDFKAPITKMSLKKATVTILVVE